MRLDDDPQARMHHKFVVIDDKLLLNGSFNFTSTAVWKNNENIMALDHPGLISKFKLEFLKLWKQYDSGVIEGNGEVDKNLIEYKKHGHGGNKW